MTLQRRRDDESEPFDCPMPITCRFPLCDCGPPREQRHAVPPRMTPELRLMMEHASGFAADRFRERGAVLPIWHAVDGKGQHMIIPAPEGASKAECCLLIRALFELREVTRYVFVDEGWLLNKKSTDLAPGELERLQRDGIRDHQDARGVVFLTAEDANGSLLAHRDVIGRRKLGPLVFEPFDGAEGRMVGMLPKPKGTVTQ